MMPINSMFIDEVQNYLLPHGPPKLQNAVNECGLHYSTRISSNFDEDIPLRKEKFMTTDYPLCFMNSVVDKF